MSDDELWERTAKALDHGDFTLLDELLTEHDASIMDLLETNGEPIDAMNEAFALGVLD
jgi:galactokinase